MKKLFCGERCSQIAKFVRYARRKLAQGTYDRPDIAEAIAIRRALLVTGFYDKQGRRVTAEERRHLLTRSNGRCEKCGRVFATEGDARFTVQHTATDAGVMLEAWCWCWRCNIEEAKSNFVPVTDEQHLAFLAKLEFRVRAVRPVLQCDDPDSWPAIYRELQRAARNP